MTSKFQTFSLFVNEGLPVRLPQPTGLPVDRCACWRHSCGQKRAEIVLNTHSTRAGVGSRQDEAMGLSSQAARPPPYWGVPLQEHGDGLHRMQLSCWA